tara:strand:- start:565 stop:747 length:183 start_codon:yes stop_codon:yes gene_type:complete
LLIPIRNSIALSESIKKLSDNSEIRHKMGERNETFIKENFDLSIVTDAYANIYKGLLNHV